MDNFKRDPKLIEMRRTVKSITTKYDRMADELIVKSIRKEYPEYTLLTEESGRMERGSEYTWVADSLDGTVNYASGNPLFCVNLALLRGGEPILGVSHAPAIGELFLAEKEGGAFLNESGISVSRTRGLKRSYLFFCEGGEKDRTRTGRINATLYPAVRDIRKLGSAGIEAAWVACGRGDAYVTTKIEPWDVAAGVLLIREAGGEVTDFEGGGWAARRADLVFSNGRVHERILALVRNL